jgi:aromatic ring-opening dioxygenase LigB subunit
VAARLVAAAPDVLVIASPHTPRLRGSWGFVAQDRLVGDFGQFRAPGVRIELPVATDAIARIRAEAAADGVPTAAIRVAALDHGAMVPLHFVSRAGWAGPTVLIALPWDGAPPAALGVAIARAAAASGQRWAVLASGDMSHRLIPGAPSGFHPRAKAFDAAFVERVTAGDLRGAAAIDADLRELAAEDVIDTTALAAAAVGWDASGHEVLAYEGPFGVGYCEAILYAEAT